MSISHENSLSVIYDQYVDHYNKAGNKMTQHISILSELHNVKEAFEERIYEKKEEFEESLSSLENILDKKIEEKASHGANDNFKNLKESKREVLSKLEYYIYYDYLSSFEEVKEFILDLLLIFYDEGESDTEFEMIKIFMEASKTEVFNFKKLQLHPVAISNLMRRIMDQNYPDQLDRYEFLSEEDKEEIVEIYSPHHNTREDLIEDLEKIIDEIENQPRFFHDDGSIKHTTVAKHAVDQDWFSDKHGYGSRGLQKHIKKLYTSMKSKAGGYE